MDILIKNIKMPKGDIPLVLIIASDGTVEEIDDSDEINETEAKAIEIPPHGDLKDKNVIKDMIVKRLSIKSLDFLCEAERVVVKCVEQAPTVLEASNG